VAFGQTTNGDGNGDRPVTFEIHETIDATRRAPASKLTSVRSVFDGTLSERARASRSNRRIIRGESCSGRDGA